VAIEHKVLKQIYDSAPLLGGRKWALHGTSSARSPGCLWWSTYPGDAMALDQQGLQCPLPRCPHCGGPLEQVLLDEFLQAAEANPASYGPAGLDTLVAAHHRVATTCRTRWERYGPKIKKAPPG